MSNSKSAKRWVSDNPVLSHPDIQGWVAVRNDGTHSVSSDDKAEKLGEVLIYFNQVTNLIAKSFNQDMPDEVHIVCDDLTAVCMPGTQETVGVIFDKDTKPNQFLAKYTTPKS